MTRPARRRERPRQRGSRIMLAQPAIASAPAAEKAASKSSGPIAISDLYSVKLSLWRKALS